MFFEVSLTSAVLSASPKSDFSNALSTIFADSGKTVIISALAAGAIAFCASLGVTPFPYIYAAEIIGNGAFFGLMQSTIMNIFSEAVRTVSKKLYTLIISDFRLREIFKRNVDETLQSGILKIAKVFFIAVCVVMVSAQPEIFIITAIAINALFAGLCSWCAYDNRDHAVEKESRNISDKLNAAIDRRNNKSSTFREFLKDLTSLNMRIGQIEKLGCPRSNFAEFSIIFRDMPAWCRAAGIDFKDSVFIQKILQNQLELIPEDKPEDKRDEFIQKVLEMDVEVFQKLTRLTILEALEKRNFSLGFMRTFKNEIENLAASFSPAICQEIRRKINGESILLSDAAERAWRSIRDISSEKLFQGNPAYFDSVALSIAFQGWAL